MKQTIKELVSAVMKTIDDAKLEGNVWPANCEYAIVVTTYAWPNTNRTEVYFSETLVELEDRVERLRRWAQLEGNHILSKDIYCWDFGPVRM